MEEGVLSGSGSRSLYPAGRPLEILSGAFRFGKTVSTLGRGGPALRAAEISRHREGVVVAARVIEDEFLGAV